MARATTLMRKYIPNFTMFDIEKESTVVFKDAYNSFLSEEVSKLETMTSEQAL